MPDLAGFTSSNAAEDGAGFWTKLLHLHIIGFYHAMHMISVVYAIARCLSVCLSHAGILSKWLHISSKFFHHQVDPPF